MADIVMGLATSHTPQLSSGADMWEDHAARDQRYSQLLGRDGEYHSYAELLAKADPGLEKELEPSIWERKYVRGQEAIAELSRQLALAEPDVVVIIGDDQREMFGDDGLPAFALFLGEELTDWPPDEAALARMPPGIRAASWAAHGQQPGRHAVCAEFSGHLTEALAGQDFDLTVLRRQPEGKTLGHAFTFPRYRLGLAASVPIVPVFINTYYPPNVPSARRCYDFGLVLRQAVESWPATAKVAVVASGGLSHFVVDEDLDQRLLAGLTAGDRQAICSLTSGQLRSGNSEILNWIAAAGALAHLPVTVVDYVPGYRTPAGTGTGMAFAYWARPARARPGGRAPRSAGRAAA
jgi:hypothetical protein